MAYNFEPGQLVQIKTWDELIEEFDPKSRGGYINNVPSGFVVAMKYLCGQFVHVREYVPGTDGRVIFTEEGVEYDENAPDRGFWYINVAVCKPVNDPEPPEIPEPDWMVIACG